MSVLYVVSDTLFFIASGKFQPRLMRKNHGYNKDFACNAGHIHSCFRFKMKCPPWRSHQIEMKCNENVNHRFTECSRLLSGNEGTRHVTGYKYWVFHFSLASTFNQATHTQYGFIRRTTQRCECSGWQRYGSLCLLLLCILLANSLFFLHKANLTGTP